MDKYEYYDIHAHFLPGMCLGCNNTDDSLKMISMMIDQGCMGVIATPHFYPNETLEDFLGRRDAAYEKLLSVLRTSPYADFESRIIMGAEVTYHPSLVFETHLADLCLGDSNYMLLEMPFAKWDSHVLKNVQNLIDTRGLRIIIAHLERFFEYGNKKLIEELLKMNVMIQMNAMHLLKLGQFRHAIDMIKNKRVDLLATDCHGVKFYPPNMQEGLAKMKKHGLEDDIERILENNFLVYQECTSQSERV